MREEIDAILEAGDLMLNAPSDLAEFIDNPSIKRSRTSQILVLFKERLERHRHVPRMYHYVCWASGTVKVRDAWGHAEYLKCSSFNGDFNCGYRGCKDGLIKGVKELDDREQHQNWLLDKVLKELK